jgi:hypothetical protein
MAENIPQTSEAPYLAAAEDYLKLFTSQYQNASKMLAWNLGYFEILSDLTDLLAGMILSLETDAGAILDLIGDIVGLKRTVDFQPSGSVSPVMDDETYVLALKAKIGLNQWQGTHDELQDLWAELFPEGTIKKIDNQDMTVTVNVTGTFNSMINDLIAHDYLIPRPEGVGLSTSIPSHPLFGFGAENDYVAGFGHGYWS